MITLKELFNKLPKEEVYDFYHKVISKPEKYPKITRLEMYNEIIKLYQDDPEIILKMCNPEEINILKSLLDDSYSNGNGYIEYILVSELIKNYLVLTNKDKFYIPKDLINYVKMAINLYEEEIYYLKDVTDSVILGIIRIHNVLKYEDFLEIARSYNVVFKDNKVKEYLKNNLRLKNKIKIVKYENDYYLTSLEYPYYKDVLKFLTKKLTFPNYKLEEIISVGKYKINLFKEPIFKLLSFLEMHLDPKFIDIILNELIIYVGFHIEDLKDLERIADHIKELYDELLKVIPYFPVWVYKGRTLNDLT